MGAAFAAKADPALGAIAEDAYAALPPEDRLLVPELFLRLVTVTDEGELALREPRRSELPAGMERVLRAFTYLVSGGDPVRLLRPALPLAWPRLREWIEADRDGLAVHRRITVATGRWQEHGRKDADLFHGSTLDDALRWVAADRTHLTLTPAERDFLASSATLTRRRSRHTRLLTVGLAALLALALGAGGLAWRQSATLAGQRDAADSARLAAASHAARGRDPVLGMLLAAASGKLSPTAAARSSLLAAAADPAAGSFRDPATGPDAVRTLTGDGRSLVSVTPGGATIWDIATGHRTAGFTGPVTGSVTGPVAGPVTAPATTGGTDRGGAAGAGNPAAAGSTVKARNTAGAGAGRTARTSTAATRPTSPDSGAGTGEGRLREVAVSRDGKVLAVVDDTGVGLWEVGSGQPLGQRIPAPADADVSLAFGEGRLLVTVGQTTQVHDWRTGKTTPLPGLRRPAVHPRGRYAVSGPDLYLLPSGKRRPGFPGVCADCDSAAAFSPDGARLAISDDDGLTVYDTRTREELAVLHGWEDHAVPVFSQDGELVAGIGAKITVWRPGADEPLLLERRPRDPVTAAAFGPDGLRYLSDDTVVTLVPAPPSDEPMDTVRLSGDGRTVAMHALGSTAITLNGRRRETGAFDDYDSELAFSPDNRLLAVRRGDHVTVRDVASWRELAALTPRFAAESESKTVLPTSKGLWTAGERTFTLWGAPGRAAAEAGAQAGAAARLDGHRRRPARRPRHGPSAAGGPGDGHAVRRSAAAARAGRRRVVRHRPRPGGGELRRQGRRLGHRDGRADGRLDAGGGRAMGRGALAGRAAVRLRLPGQHAQSVGRPPGAADRPAGRAHRQRPLGRLHRRLGRGAGRRQRRPPDPPADHGRGPDRDRLHPGRPHPDGRRVAPPPAGARVRTGLPAPPPADPRVRTGPPAARRPARQTRVGVAAGRPSPDGPPGPGAASRAT
ncbi:hypothetical protein GCM10020001_076190 [Nonomuraea salmonea]